MKTAVRFFLPIFLLTFGTSSAQLLNTRNRLDSSFTLAKHLRQDKPEVGQHGVLFTEFPKQVVKDLGYIKTLSLVDLTKYRRQVIREKNHFVKIWNAEKSAASILKIIEINSIYLIDTVEKNEQRFKATIFFNDYFILLKDSTRNVWYQTIHGQGINNYAIGNRQVYTQREAILVGLFYVDNKKEIKQLLSKYGCSLPQFFPDLLK